MAARVFAVIAAVAMVAGAIFVRSRIDSHTERSSTTLRLVCATEFGAVCDALVATGGNQVVATVEPAATTADRLRALGPADRSPLDGWLVSAPWPRIVADAQSRAGRAETLTAGRVLARSPVVLAVRADRQAALTAQCKVEPGWKCLGDVAGQPWTSLPGGKGEWGTVKPGHPNLTGVAGLAVLGAASVGYFDGRVDLSATDLADDGFLSWLNHLEQAVPNRPESPLQTMLQRPSSFDVVGALEAEAGPLLATARTPKPVLLYPSPVATADVVLATTQSRAARRLGDLVSGKSGRRALATSGWRVEGEPFAPGLATGVKLPATANLPEPGVLEALRPVVAQAGR